MAIIMIRDFNVSKKIRSIINIVKDTLQKNNIQLKNKTYENRGQFDYIENYSFIFGGELKFFYDCYNSNDVYFMITINSIPDNNNYNIDDEKINELIREIHKFLSENNIVNSGKIHLYYDNSIKKINPIIKFLISWWKGFK